MNSLRYLNTVLTILAVLLAGQLWTSWTQSPDLTRPAYGQGLPDEGALLKQAVDELKLLNQKAQQTNDLLTSGKVTVQVELPEGAQSEE